MSGKEYLEAIRGNLETGNRQSMSRMGEKVLGAFGYVRRRATAINEINETLNNLGLVADPPISKTMPLKTPRISFSLRDTDDKMPNIAGADSDTSDANDLDSSSEDEDNIEISLPDPAFRISELESANIDVECISPNASLEAAYTTMRVHKYSQLVVASGTKPRQPDVKGIVSFESIAKAFMNGNPQTVGDCIDKTAPFADIDDDLNSAIGKLSESDVVLVIGRDKRLQGIITAWDLADEFAKLVDPFKRIGEIEWCFRILVEKRLGKDRIAQFLGDDPPKDLEELTMGELQMILDYPEHWNLLELPFDRAVFIKALDEIRDYRNRLMHFRDPLKEPEVIRTQLTTFCDMVREINLE